MRKALWILGLGFPLVMGACNVRVSPDTWPETSSIHGSGKLVTEERKVPMFRGVELASSGTVDIQVDAAQKVTMEIDDNLLPEITTEVRNGVLRIGARRGVNTSAGLRVHVSAPELVSVVLSGSGDIHARGINSDTLGIVLSGSGDIELSGVVNRIDTALSGSGELKLGDLHAKQVDMVLTGSGLPAYSPPRH